MIVLACKNIKKAFGVETILEDVTFHIQEKEKVGLVGVNGAGKSTVMKIIAGITSCDGGAIQKAKEAQIGYLSQNTVMDSSQSIYDELLTVFSPIIQLEQKIRQLEIQISEEKDPVVLEQHMNQYTLCSEQFSKLDGFSYQSLLRGTLIGLGFREEEFQKPISTLSGGQKTRVALAKLLLQKPEILLLDEPTNHLDIDSIEWLEGFLQNYPGAILLISHDRYFLDKVVEKIVEIENKVSETYNGNYSFYVKHKEINREIQLKHYEAQQKEIARQEDLIRRYGSCGSEKRIKMAQSRMKQLEKIDTIELPKNLPKQIRFSIEPKITSGVDVLKAENISKSFDQKKLFSNVSFSIHRGEKIALIGPNGIGKTTLLKILLNQTCTNSGNIDYGSNVKISYYDQEQSTLNLDNTIINEIWDAYPKLEHQQIRDVLALFLFTGEEVHKKISSLSGGEKGRVSLAKIMLSDANFLILDEPTNHLDLSSKEMLEEVLTNYKGTLLFISHDRYFINKVATKVFELSCEGVKQYLGNYEYYLEKIKENTAVQSIQQSTLTSSTQTASSAKEDWLRRKEEAAKARKKAQELKKLEDLIEESELKLAETEEAMCLEENYSNLDKAQALHQLSEELKEKIEEYYLKWEELTSE